MKIIVFVSGENTIEELLIKAQYCCFAQQGAKVFIFPKSENGLHQFLRRYAGYNPYTSTERMKRQIEATYSERFLT